MKILITGVAGFIGSNLADNLISNGYDVIGIDNLAYGILEQIPEMVQFHKLDIRSPDIYPVFQDVDVVFHFAAKNCISDCQLNPLETCDINVTGTVNVFEAARQARVRKVVYAESSAIYEGSSVLPTPETEAKPESFYATSKMSSMYFAEAYARFSDMVFTALRYFCVYGPRQDYRRSVPPVMSAFIIKLLRGEAPVIYGTGKKQRDFIFIDDINDFHLRCIHDDRTDQHVFNLGSGECYSILDIYQMISEILDIRIPPSFKPDMPGEALETLADITRASQVDWLPKTKLREGLERMVAFIRDEIKRGRIL